MASGGGRHSAGYRRSRLSNGRTERRRRLARFILTGGVIAAAAVFLALSVYVRTRDPGPGDEPIELLDGSGSGNVIFTARDEAGKFAQLAVLTAGPEGGYSFYTIPVRTVTTSPGYGFQQLDVLYETGGQEAVDQAAADLLQLPIQYHVTLSHEALQTLAQAAGTINFTTAKPLVMNASPDGTQAGVTLPAGDNPNGVSTSVSLMNQAAGDNGDGPRVLAAFYLGLRETLKAKPEVDRRALARQLLKQIETDMGEDRFLDLFADVTDPRRQFGVWPVPVKATGEGGSWYFEPLADELDVLLTGSPADASYLLEIQNGTETPGVVEAVSIKLEPLRFATVLKPEPSGVNFDVTQIRCGVDAIEAGNRVQASLGTGTIIKDEFLEKKQIIVIIGRDIAAAMPGQAVPTAPGPSSNG